jgi:hypothetical protein
MENGRLRQITVILFLMLVGVPAEVSLADSNCEGFEQSENVRFTDKQIRQNVHKYMDVILGDPEPTLQDYFNFEGTHGESTEDVLELEQCECREWTPSLDSEDCGAFIQGRADNASKEPSYYYRFLRSLLGRLRHERLLIRRVNHVTEGKDEVQAVLVDAKLGPLSLEFYHAGDSDAVPLGLVMLSKINGESINDIIVKRKKNCP